MKTNRDVYRVIADPTRREIINLIARRSCDVKSIAMVRSRKPFSIVKRNLISKSFAGKTESDGLWHSFKNIYNRRRQWTSRRSFTKSRTFGYLTIT